MAAISMAEKKKNNPKQEQEDEEESIIPVLTVLKNNTILKNIFIILDDDKNQVLIGRHPDCNIVLTHPSISRFHLNIHSNPSSRTLSLLDLSSVHGTWVCGRKLQPNVRVDLKEGDTFTLGVSTRLYRLNWVPLTQINAFVPQQIIKDENLEQEIQMSEEGIVSFSCDEESKNHCEDHTFGDLNGSFRTETSPFPTNSDRLCGCLGCVLSPPYVHSVDETDNTRKIEASPEVGVLGETNLLCILGEYLTHNVCLPVVEAVQGTKIQQFQAPPDTFDEKDAAAVAVMSQESEFECTVRDNDRVEDILTAGARIFNFENKGLLVGEDISGSEFHPVQVVEEVSVDSMSHGERLDECSEEYKSKLQDLDAKSCHDEQGYLLDELVEDKRIISIDPVSSGENDVGAVTAITTESEFECTVGDNERIDDMLTTKSRMINSENACMVNEEAIPVTEFQRINIVEEVAVDPISDGENEDKCGKELRSKLQASLNAQSCHELGDTVDETAEGSGNKYTSRISSTSFGVEPPNSSMPQECLLDITNKIENQTPQSLLAVLVTESSEMESIKNCVESMEKSSTFGNIRSRRGMVVASAPQARATKSRVSRTSNVDTDVKMRNVKHAAINKSLSKDLFFVFDEENEICTPSKENLSPNVYHLRFVTKKGKPEKESQHSSIQQRSHKLKAGFSPDIYSAESLSAISNKENQTPKLAHKTKPQREPLGWHINLAHERDIMELKMNSGGNCKPATPSPVFAAKDIDDSTNCQQISNEPTKPLHISKEQKRGWDMVVDTASLLNKESRKALQLLQGLKGTRLIIPRLVIRELDSMKQQFKIFRRTSEASLALEWLEECMENTKPWIHIQSSIICRQTASIPPVSPHNQFIKERWAFPAPNSSKECSSPTVEDHIIDFALQYRRNENVGQLVLLSDDVTLKIKSMAKGLLCETVQQFRQSLVTPFSERFMWPKSSPRGLTWSCQDDVVLREKYCGLPSKAGLRLIIS
ncbi:hypothetical protein RJT34_24762 [Clitoria ternatea]|uniref:FHA domain-containing protein n=1 Tax=Clitoria ternatea TaxID=43366 RepID=A0AAN9FUR7_CLITE